MAKIQEEEKAKFCQPSLGGMFASALAVILGIFVHTFLRSATPAFFAYEIVAGLYGTIPKVRYRSHIGTASSEVSEVKVAVSIRSSRGDGCSHSRFHRKAARKLSPI